MIFCNLILLFACQAQDPDPLMQEINGKINEVSSQFAELNKKLREVTDGPEQNQLIEEALQSADGLETSIEELLAMLPEPPPSPNSSGSSSSSSEEPPRNIDESTPQQSLPEQQGQSPNDQEHPDGQGANQQPPPSSLFQQQQQFGGWGQLPPRLESALQHSDPNNMPLRYRRLLIRYHRKATAPDE